jgi:trans-aconitate methyltransferase
VNIGGGSSVLVDRLLDEGYSDVTVLDVSATALALAQERLGSRSTSVTWIEADVIEHSFDRTFEVWHDRAVLHFLTDTASQNRYVDRLREAVAPGGYVIIAAFAPDGPETCSGLPVKRYSFDSLSHTLGVGFEAIGFEHETHRTPGGSEQQFLYGHFQRRSSQAS